MANYYVHRFTVTMVVENVSAKRDALSWLEARLCGGDAHFYASPEGETHKLTKKESEAFYESGELPERFDEP